MPRWNFKWKFLLDHKRSTSDLNGNLLTLRFCDSLAARAPQKSKLHRVRFLDALKRLRASTRSLSYFISSCVYCLVTYLEFINCLVNGQTRLEQRWRHK
jgi:hypothetical protein